MTCDECSAQIPVKPGRVPKFCSGACRQRAYRRRRRDGGLPSELTSLHRWTARDGKRPVRVDGSPASSTKAWTWTAYAAVKDRPHGIMLGDGLACWDLDGVIDADGRLHADAVEVLKRVGSDALWVERSMSGRGLHVFVRGRGSSWVTDRVSYFSHSRFIAVTGDRYVYGGLRG